MPMNDALRSVRDVIEEHREFVGQVRTATQPGGKAGQAPKGVSKAVVRETNREMVKAFAKEFRAGRWTMHVPGQHYGGLSNQALLEVRAREGRDFNAHTVQLDQRVSKELMQRWGSFDARVVTLDELREDAEAIVRIHVTERFLDNGADVQLTPLTPAYAKAKRAAGYGGRPIGVRRGRHLAAIQRGLTLRWKR